MTEYALYLDDSGHPDGKPYVVVAGFIASESQWLDFEPKWKHALKRFGLEDPFHMTEFMREHRTELKEDWILGTLSKLINDHTEMRFGSAIEMSAYKRINEKYALEEWIGTPLTLNAREIAKQFAEWKEEKSEDRFLPFIEQGCKHFGDVEQVFKRDRLPRPIPVPKTLASVQPADMLAWEIYNFCRTGVLRKNAKRLARLRSSDFGAIYRDSELEKTCIAANTPLRALVNPGDTFASYSERKRKRKRTI
jgi:hypothetical protein